MASNPKIIDCEWSNQSASIPFSFPLDTPFGHTKNKLYSGVPHLFDEL